MEFIIYQLAIGIVYTAIIASLVWARFRFFKITTSKSKMISYINDPAVFIQLSFTYALLWQVESLSPVATASVILVYLASLALFWWAILTAGALDFASSDVKGSIFTKGAFGLVRHPFYVSYIMVWFASSALLNSVFLWVSCFVLVGIYVVSAREEEKSIVQGPLASKYISYRDRVGMFFPRN